jgi:hypothetical protein
MADESPDASLIDMARRAFADDDAARVRELLAKHPTLRALIDAPVGPFESPAIVNVRSREMLDVLLEAGANINARSQWWAGGFGLLDSASPALCAYAISRGAVLTAHAAAKLGMVDDLRRLVSADPSLVHARGGDGQTPLHFASNIEVAALLVEHGADINARDVDHESIPAQWMIRDRQDVARWLVARGCETDVLMAAALGDLDLIRRILDATPDAIRMRVSDEYFSLIGGKTGGTIYQWTLGWYVSAHQVARSFKHPEALALLLDRSPADVRLIDACWMGDQSTAKALLAADPEMVTRLSAADRKQVAHAARENNTAAVRAFLECGWPVDARSQHQGTPLHWAAFHGNLELTEMILRFKPPLDIRDADHHSTPLGWATYGSEHGWNCEAGDYPGTIDALQRAGAV